MSNNNKPFISLEYQQYDEAEMLQRSKDYFELMRTRRTVRTFSDKPIDMRVVENIIKTAGSAPSGANKQPWTFCVITNAELKKEIRKAAEQEEYESYHYRMSERWLKDLEKLETDWNKPFLERAPVLIAVFKRIFEKEGEEKFNNYYVSESVGLATGLLISAIHNAGLASLTYTPSPMNFLQKLLKRPENERAYLLIPIGYPDHETKVPDIDRKGLDDILVNYI